MLVCFVRGYAYRKDWAETVYVELSEARDTSLPHLSPTSPPPLPHLPPISPSYTLPLPLPPLQALEWRERASADSVLEITRDYPRS